LFCCTYPTVRAYTVHIPGILFYIHAQVVQLSSYFAQAIKVSIKDRNQTKTIWTEHYLVHWEGSVQFWFFWMVFIVYRYFNNICIISVYTYMYIYMFLSNHLQRTETIHNNPNLTLPSHILYIYKYMYIYIILCKGY
jgi:hypothetical protein